MRYKVKVEFVYVDEIEVDAETPIDAQNIVEDIICSPSYKKVPEGSDFQLVSIEDEHGRFTDLL